MPEECWVFVPVNIPLNFASKYWFGVTKIFISLLKWLTAFSLNGTGDTSFFPSRFRVSLRGKKTSNSKHLFMSSSLSSLRSWDAWLNSIWSIWVNFSCCLSFIIKWHLHTELAQVCIWILCFEVIPGSSLCFIRNFICFIWSWPCKPHRVRIQRVKDFYCFYNQNGCFFGFWESFKRIVQENHLRW